MNKPIKIDNELSVIVDESTENIKANDWVLHRPINKVCRAFHVSLRDLPFNDFRKITHTIGSKTLEGVPRLEDEKMPPVNRYCYDCINGRHDLCASNNKTEKCCCHTPVKLNDEGEESIEDWLEKEGYPITMPMTRSNLANIIDGYVHQAALQNKAKCYTEKEIDAAIIFGIQYSGIYSFDRIKSEFNNSLKPPTESINT